MTSAHTASAVPGRLRTYASFVRFEHTLFSLPLILAGVFCARGAEMSFVRWALVAVAAVAARTSALALNRVIDRRIDALNPRTRTRELPAGKVGLLEARLLILVSTGVYAAACAALGPIYLKLALVPLAVFALYPYLKRFTPLCHAGVGVALSLAPLAGYAAAHPDLGSSGPAFALAGFAFFWVTGFDIIYATLDEAFDREAGLHSMVVALGRAGALRVSWGLHVGAMTALAWAAWLLVTSTGAVRLPWAGVTIACWAASAALLWLEQRWAEDVNLAFFKTNVVVGFLVLATVLAARMASGGF